MYKWVVVAVVAMSFAFAAPLASQGRGGDDWRKRAEKEIGWGENGDEERILPGDTVDTKDKEARLKEEAEKLGLEDDKEIKNFIKIGKKAWEKAEREDKRWAGAYKKAKSDEDRLAKETEDHKEKLEKIWADCDKDLLKKELIDEDGVAKFKENTKDLREETATDKSIKQDEIRERKMEEWLERARQWRGANRGGDGGDGEAKKEKKDDEE